MCATRFSTQNDTSVNLRFLDVSLRYLHANFVQIILSMLLFADCSSPKKRKIASDAGNHNEDSHGATGGGGRGGKFKEEYEEEIFMTLNELMVLPRNLY